MYSELKQKFRYKNPLRTDAIIKNAKECCKELRHSFFSDTLSSKYEWYFFPCGVYTGQLYISCFRKKERTGIMRKKIDSRQGLYRDSFEHDNCGIGAIVIWIWGILEGVKILDGRINTDANGVFLKD